MMWQADVTRAMAKTPAPPPPVTVAVIGLPSAQNDRKGSGKSCICDRFLHPSPDEYTGGWGSTIVGAGRTICEWGAPLILNSFLGE